MALPRFSNKDFLFFWRKLERWVSIKREYKKLNHLIRSSSAALNSAFIKFLSLDSVAVHTVTKYYEHICFAQMDCPETQSWQSKVCVWGL